MPIQYINTGSVANNGNGDTIRLAFTKVNENFSLLSTPITFAKETIGQVISNPEWQNSITVTYDSSTQYASFSLDVARHDHLGGVKIGAGISVDGAGVISAFNGDYNNLTNIPQPLGTTDSPIFANVNFNGYALTVDSHGDLLINSTRLLDKIEIIGSNITSLDLNQPLQISSAGTSTRTSIIMHPDYPEILVAGELFSAIPDTYSLGANSYTWRGIWVGTDGIQFNDGSSITSSIGLIGPTGYVGSLGYTGSIGYTGSLGGTGYIGSVGYDGSLGYTGSLGLTGNIGFTGSFGSTGYIGSRGSTGTVGFTGSIGSTGTVGYTGSLGGIGYTGSIGSTGTVGYTGSKGSTGTIGFTGSLGGVGYTGSIGYDGSKGYTGTIGFTGSLGGTGYTGSLGYSGSQGIQGIQGPLGSSGTTLILPSREIAVNTDVGNAEYVQVYRYWTNGPDIAMTYKVSTGTVLTGVTRRAPDNPIVTWTDFNEWQAYVDSLIQVQFANGKMGTLVVPPNSEIHVKCFGTLSNIPEPGNCDNLNQLPDDTDALQRGLDYCSHRMCYLQLGNKQYKTYKPLEWGVDTVPDPANLNSFGNPISIAGTNWRANCGVRGTGSSNNSGTLTAAIIYIVTLSDLELPYAFGIRTSQYSNNMFTDFTIKCLRYNTNHVYSSPTYNDTYVTTYGFDHKEGQFTDWRWTGVTISNTRYGWGFSVSGPGQYTGNGEFELFTKCTAQSCQKIFYMADGTGQSFGQMFIKCGGGGNISAGSPEYAFYDIGSGLGGYGLHVIDCDATWTITAAGVITYDANPSTNPTHIVNGYGTKFTRDCPPGSRIFTYELARECIGTVVSVISDTQLILSQNDGTDPRYPLTVPITSLTGGVEPGAFFLTDKQYQPRTTLLKDRGVSGLVVVDGGRFEGLTTLIDNQNPFDTTRTFRNMDLAGVFSTDKDPFIVSGYGTLTAPPTYQGNGTIFIQDCSIPMLPARYPEIAWPLAFVVKCWSYDQTTILFERCSISTRSFYGAPSPGLSMPEGSVYPFSIYSPTTDIAWIEFKDCTFNLERNFNKFYGLKNSYKNIDHKGIPQNLIRVPEIFDNASLVGGVVPNLSYLVVYTPGSSTCTMVTGTTAGLRVGQTLSGVIAFDTTKSPPKIQSIVNSTRFTIDDITKILTTATSLTNFGIYAPLPWIHETSSTSFLTCQGQTNYPNWLGSTTYSAETNAFTRLFSAPPGIALYQDLVPAKGVFRSVFVDIETNFYTNIPNASGNDRLLFQLINSVTGNIYDEVKIGGNSTQPNKFSLVGREVTENSTGTFRLRISTPNSNVGEAGVGGFVERFELFKISASANENSGNILPTFNRISITTTASTATIVTATVLSGINEIVPLSTYLYDNSHIPNRAQVLTVTKTSLTSGTITLTTSTAISPGNVSSGTSTLTRATKEFTQHWNSFDKIMAVERLALPHHTDSFIGKGTAVNTTLANKFDIESDIYLSTESEKITYSANNTWWEIPRVVFASAQPTTGSWIAGDFVENSTKSELGTAGSKYVLQGWDRMTTGPTNVATDWLQRRTLTGN